MKEVFAIERYEISFKTKIIVYKIAEDNSRKEICRRGAKEIDLFRTIDEYIISKFQTLFFFNNPKKIYSTKEWGYANRNKFKSHNELFDNLLWTCPKPDLEANAFPSVCIRCNEKYQKKLSIFLNKLPYHIHDKYSTQKANDQLLGKIKDTECHVLKNIRQDTGDWLYFFPNTEAEVDIVFDVIEKLGFFEGWKKNPNYKKSSQENSTISCEPEGNTDKSIQTEDYVEPDTVEENTIEIEAVKEIELPKENLDFLASEEDDTYEIDYRPEGREKVVMQTVYERNPENRRICIEHYKYNDCDKRIKCQLCGFDFEAIYGDLGRDFIEVHHKIPLSETRREIYIDPKEDLIPVCSNCHRILHRGNNGNDYSENLEKLTKLFTSKENNT